MNEVVSRGASAGIALGHRVGTGSPRSLAYIVPIVGHVRRRGSRRGTQAIVVYPMNALANSRLGDLGAAALPEGSS